MNLRHPLKSLASVRSILKSKQALAESQFVLLDTPLHSNIGDLAIALAERKFITEQLHSTYCEINAQVLDFNENIVSRLANPSQTVLVHGGGFLGSLWPGEELRFRRILSDFKHHKIIVFPQTITFFTASKQDYLFLKESQRAYYSHPDLTICVRETRSKQLMDDLFPEIKTELIPDIVTSLNIALPSRNKRNEVLVCMRHDHEKQISTADLDNLLYFLRKEFNDVSLTDTIAKQDPTNLAEAENLVLEKLREFQEPQLIITDRLHGMIFAAIVGTPCIAINNTNRKVEGMYQWLKDLEYIYFADNIQSAQQIIKELDLSKNYTFDNTSLEPYFNKLKNIMLPNH